MIAQDTVRIIKEICALIGDAGGDCSQWHIGVTANPNDRRCAGSPEDSRWRICRRASSAWEARDIVKGFWNIDCQRTQISFDAFEGDSAVYIFAYRNVVRPQPAIAHGLLTETQREAVGQIQAECVC